MGADRVSGASGRITVLVCALVVILAAIIGVGASATYVTTQQRKLLAVSDAAAAVAADRIVVPASGAPGLAVDPSGVRTAVADHLGEIGAVAGLEDLRIRSVVVQEDGVTVRVRLRARIGLPWAAALLGTGPDVTATSWVRPGLTR